MLGNRQLRTALESVERQISPLEAAILTEGRSADLATTLAELWAQRRLLRQLLRVRTIESRKPVVDFRKWRDGDGALQLMEARARGRADAAAASERRSNM